MVTHHAKDGQIAVPRKSSTILWKVTPGLSPTIIRFVTQYYKDGHWSPTVPEKVTYQPKYGQPPSQDSHPPSQGWSPIVLYKSNDLEGLSLLFYFLFWSELVLSLTIIAVTMESGSKRALLVSSTGAWAHFLCSEFSGK